MHVGAYCIRPTNDHDHGQMIDPPDTFWGVCNMHIPIWDKYLINTYLLKPIPGKDWIVCVWACCIRSTNDHDHGLMMDQLDTFRGVCNMPLPIQTKNLIIIYRMNQKPGTCWGVCNTPISICDKYVINMYLLNLIPGKD